MFGLEILDVAIGLMLVYLLLALFATALNEYIAAVLNLRGKELARGLGRLLDDLDEGDALRTALDGAGRNVTTATASITEQLYNHPLIRPFSTRQGWATRFLRYLRGSRGNPRLPSYIPARTFALALLDVLGVDEKDTSLERLVPAVATPTPAMTSAQQSLTEAEAAAAAPGANKEQAAKAVAAARAKLVRARAAGALAEAEQALAAARAAHAAAPAAEQPKAAQAVTAAQTTVAKIKFAQVLGILKQESPIELTEHLEILSGLPQADKLAGALQVQVAGLVAGAQTQLQKLHDGVEVWFNNAMDRVSGAYKRTAQGWLFVLGVLIASCMNADTIDMWRRLEADDELRNAMVRRAEATVAEYDSTLAKAVTDSVALVSRTTDTTAAPDTMPPRNPPAPGSTASSDTTKPDSTPAVEQARDNYHAARARLDSLELKLGWTQEEAVRVGLLEKDKPKAKPDPVRNVPQGSQAAAAGRPDSTAKPASTTKADSARAKRGWVPDGYNVGWWFPFRSGAGFLKVIGLLLTALAISMGAPFWFDLLNKAISIRAAGRSPEEKPKSPEGSPKRLAEHTPK